MDAERAGMRVAQGAVLAAASLPAVPAATATGGDAGIAETVHRFAFANASEGWQVLAFLVLAAGLAWWTWRRYGPTPERFGALARAARVLGMLIVVALLAGPTWYRTDTTFLPGRALVTVDRSASMELRDGPLGARRIDAAAQLGATIAARADAARLTVELRSLGGSTQTIAPASAAAGLPADGPLSPLGEELASLISERRPDLIVLASDGRVTDGPALADTIARWPRGSRDPQVLILALGGDVVPPELWIDEVRVNREVPVGEVEPLGVRLSIRAPTGPVTVLLDVDGVRVGERSLTLSADPQDPLALVQGEVGLDATVMHEGSVPVIVTARMPDAASASGGVIERRWQGAITATKRKIGVLLLDRQPRREANFLFRSLQRDKTMRVHAYLGDGKWRRWDADGPDHLPLTGTDLVQYDVVVVGDLAASDFKPAEQQALVDAVKRKGLGLILLPGERGSLASFTGSALEALLPALLPDAPTIARGYLDQRPRRLQRTPLAERQNLLDARAGDAKALDWPQLPSLLGACPVRELRPASEVLATAEDGTPLVITGPVGSGRSVLLCSDDTWRWRRNVGDQYLHRYWSQLLRYAGGGRRSGGTAWRLFAAPRRAVLGETVTLALAPAVPNGEALPDTAAVRLIGPPAGPGLPPIERVVRLSAEPGGFSARIPAPAPGLWRLEPAAGPDLRSVDAGELLVAPPGAELRDPRSDRPGLEAFARASGGQVFTDPAALLAELARKDLRTARSITSASALWDAWWVLALVVACFAIDWSLRRWSRLP